jgi:hypothetical protein
MPTTAVRVKAKIPRTIALKYTGTTVQEVWTATEEAVFRRAMASALDRVPSEDNINVTRVEESTRRRLLGRERQLVASTFELDIDFTITLVSDITNIAELGDTISADLIAIFSTPNGTNATGTTSFDSLLEQSATELAVTSSATVIPGSSVAYLGIAAIVKVLNIVTGTPSTAPSIAPTPLPSPVPTPLPSPVS